MVCEIRQTYSSRAVKTGGLLFSEGVNDDHRGVRRGLISGNALIRLHSIHVLYARSCLRKESCAQDSNDQGPPECINR